MGHLWPDTPATIPPCATSQNLSPGFGRESSQNTLQQKTTKTKAALPVWLLHLTDHFTILTRSTQPQRGSCPSFFPSLIPTWCSGQESPAHTVCGTCCAVLLGGGGVHGSNQSELIPHRNLPVVQTRASPVADTCFMHSLLTHDISSLPHCHP